MIHAKNQFGKESIPRVVTLPLCRYLEIVIIMIYYVYYMANILFRI